MTPVVKLDVSLMIATRSKGWAVAVISVGRETQLIPINYHYSHVKVISLYGTENVKIDAKKRWRSRFSLSHRSPSRIRIYL